MTIDTKIRHETPADGNVFLDLGFSPKEATPLKVSFPRSAMRRLHREQARSYANRRHPAL